MSRRNLHRIQIAILSIIFLLAATIVAQQREPDEVIKVNTDLVVFDAQVVDKKSKRIIGDLTRDDFAVTDNGVKQPISYFSRDELPLSIILLLDVSRSVRPIIHDIRDGALNALQRLKPDDQVAVMAFASETKLAQDFTKDRALVSRKIEEATATDVLGNATFVGPALESAAIHMERAPTMNSRRVIIIITDNIAATSERQQHDVLDQLFDTGTVVYGLIVRATIGRVFNIMSFGQIKAVNKFVDETGGEVLGAGKTKVDQRLGLIIDRLRARYAIGFRPSKAASESFRPVEIKISNAKSRSENLLVLTKRGYYLRTRS
ncbi:MAG TPA: VWA domain-containing protein [Pyrinomonadaceae bacterium]|nr:VWA domain-containing protein [Pyrinomonadaceae bacterium]